jgi:enamine deaminase RidA (YjgF/YER057c/UK114 family)
MPAIDARLKELGIVLPDASTPAFNYIPWTRSGNVVFISGQIPRLDGKPAYLGKLGQALSAEQGYEAAKNSALSLVAHLQVACGGDLDRVVKVLKLTGFVNSAPDFTDQPKVVNGASDLFVAIFGDKGRHARSAVGMASLPMGVAVEIEGIFEIS